MSIERPRVRTDGPGGPDVKQGARIACLDCRTAKIRCSAPTDGEVPCKRCSRHGKDCVFEKHRRGRKPGRTSSNNSYVSSGGHNDHHINENSRNIAHQAPLHHHFDIDERVKRQAEYPAYQRGQSRTEASYAVPSLPHHPTYHSFQSTSGEAGTSSLNIATQTWSPSPISSSLNEARFKAAGTSANVKIVSPLQNHQDAQSSRSRTQSSHALLGSSREHHQQSSPHPSYLPTLPSQSGTSPILSTHPFHHRSLSPRRQGNSDGSFGLQLGPITPSFAASTSSNPGGKGSSLAGVMSPSSASRAPSSYPALTSSTSMPRFNTMDRQLTPGGGLPSSSIGQGVTPSKSWLDLPSPGSKTLFSPSHPSILSSSLSTANLSNTSSAPYWPGAAVVSSTTVSNGSSQKRKPIGDYFSGIPASTHTTAQEAREDEGAKARMEHREEGGKKKRMEERVDDGARRKRMESGPRESNADEGENEEEDQLDEDDVGGEPNEDVLATPLTLLAHASDAAATLQGHSQRRDSFGSRRMGAATMGLVSPPVPKLAPPRRWFDSGRLPNLGPGWVNSQARAMHAPMSPILSRPLHREYPGSDSGKLGDMAPPFGPLLRYGDKVRSGVAWKDGPPSLGSIGRSRSYTTVERVHRQGSLGSSPPAAEKEQTREATRSTVTDAERRAEVLGKGTYTMAGFKLEDSQLPGNSMAPSTLDHDAWEYRDGRVRARKSMSTASSGRETSLSAESGKRAASKADTSTSAKSAASTTATAVAAKADCSDPTVAPSLEAQGHQSPGGVKARRWQIVRRRIGTEREISEAEAESVESETLGASHRDFFALSIFHSKMDNEKDFDPVQQGLVELRELEKLFDIFFARINPLLNILDPFLHSVYYVRTRSALLTTVIAAIAARLSDHGRDPELAVRLEKFWRHTILPEVLLEGYKSVELSQAFLILSLYHKPTNRLADDRSWQYLGFAIRIATEVGVNRITLSNESIRNNEQVQRRIRNRSRLWINLFLSDRALSYQNGRPWTITEDEMIARSDLWHTEDFALPEDSRLVSSVKLAKIVERYSAAFKETTDALALPLASSNLFQWKVDIKSLLYTLSKSIAELERWREVWCTGSLEGCRDGSQSQAVADTLEKWQTGANRRYFYGRLNMCSRVLQSLERTRNVAMAAAKEQGTLHRIKASVEEIEGHIQQISFDAWQSGLGMIDLLLQEEERTELSASPNQTAVMAIYCALAALRLARPRQRGPIGPLAEVKGPDEQMTLSRCRQLAAVLIDVGRTPNHRNSAATSYGLYLEGIVTLWESSVLPDASVGSVSLASLPSEDHDGANEEPRESKTRAKTVEFNGNTDRPPTGSSLGHKRRKVTSLDGALHLSMPTTDVAQQPFSVGDEVWGLASGAADGPGSVVASDPEAMDRMWDYLTTYPDPSSGFPLSLWQTVSSWSNSLPTSRASNVAHTL